MKIAMWSIGKSCWHPYGRKSCNSEAFLLEFRAKLNAVLVLRLSACCSIIRTSRGFLIFSMFSARELLSG
ncbi:hypothetical protein Y032_0071g519 [Ancylostoma ceylanicum]|uniref:Uncharacterized protein n=1 Tax=Ancylostoma ceylanicum TaxID=53326 RepID=A0A016TVY2_9BILA|nr:hypothetical protein Y032_0071g519 [Ancylostoma ceylanicum]